jgi:hypothetical protein
MRIVCSEAASYIVDADRYARNNNVTHQLLQPVGFKDLVCGLFLSEKTESNIWTKPVRHWSIHPFWFTKLSVDGISGSGGSIGCKCETRADSAQSVGLLIWKAISWQQSELASICKTINPLLQNHCVRCSCNMPRTVRERVGGCGVVEHATTNSQRTVLRKLNSFCGGESERNKTENDLSVINREINDVSG